MLNLPREILVEIVAYVGPSQQMLDGVDTRYRPRVCLLHLALTCKTLRDLALPKLYEIVTLSRHPVKLLRSLATTPTNVAYIKKVILSMSLAEETDKYPSAADAQIFNDILRRRFATRSVKLFPDERITKTEIEGVDVDDDDELPATYYTILLALAPQVQSIVCKQGYEPMAKVHPGSLEQLRYLACHFDQIEGGFNFDAVQNIFDAAPNLQRFVAYSFSSMSPSLTYNSITEIRLGHSKIDPDCMSYFFQAFPNLETFAYSGGGSEVGDLPEPMPRQFWQGLRCLKGTLRHLWLEHDEMEREYFEPLTDRHLMGPLSCMDCLETIQIQAGFLYTDFNKEKESVDFLSEEEAYALFQAGLGATKEEIDYYYGSRYGPEDDDQSNGVDSEQDDNEQCSEDEDEDNEEENWSESDAENENDGYEINIGLNNTQVNVLGAAANLNSTIDTGNDDYDLSPEDILTANTPQGRLVSFLPRSIRKFVVFRAGPSAKDDIIELGKVAPEKFPNLKEVGFPAIDPNMEDIAHIFREQGIKCTFKHEAFEIYGDWQNE